MAFPPTRIWPLLSIALLTCCLVCLDLGCREQQPQVSANATELGVPLDFDFDDRDAMPQTDVPTEQWNTRWGPAARTYPRLFLPQPVSDPIAFKRMRVIAAAKKYIGLPYQHKHIPAAGGLDCSNFTSWVYNYSLGEHFTSNVVHQSAQVGRRLEPGEPLQAGDLLFQWDKERHEIGHVAIYIDPSRIIDATKGSVKIRPLKGWYKTRHSHARRVIE